MTAETHVNIDDIKVVDRHRRDLGDIDGLVRSIEDVGLINPITLTPDFRLVAGGRRLAAYKRLGRDTIPARVVESLTDAAAALRAERDENTCRKDMLPSEMAALGEALYEIEAGAAKERQLEAQRRGGKTRHGLDSGPLTTNQNGNARDAVGDALGMAGRTYSALRSAYTLANDETAPPEERELAQEALAKMDQGRGIRTTGDELTRRLRAKREAQEVKVAALADPEPEQENQPEGSSADWIPTPEEKGPKPSARRRELIREWASKGWTSQQMGDRLGILPQTIRANAREQGVTIPADETLGVRTRTSIDSNRIVRETVNQLDGLEMSFDLIDFDDLDRSEIEHWTASLTQSIRVLNRLNKKLKEMVQ